MIQKKFVRAKIVITLCFLVVTSLFSQLPVMAHASINTVTLPTFRERFLTLYNEIKSPSSGYFSPQGIPYHSIETLMVEAPDYGHETTSETFSYWLMLEATYGKVTGNWQPFNQAWLTMEKYMIPSHADQPTNSGYNPAKPATYAAEKSLPSLYPSQLQPNVSVGQDPLFNELKQTYNTSDIYGMAWLLDTDNWYGFGHCGDHTSKPVFINTFQRGSQESVWETVPQPSCETFAFGGKNGFLDLFTGDSNYAKQWRYTDAPDADARAIQAAYWAYTWAKAQGKEATIAPTIAKAAKMGDYLRYSFFDKYFKKMGCTSENCAAGTGKDSSDYLLSWYYAWGGSLDTSNPWAWRIGSSSAHFGYQNPLAAWALSSVPALKPHSPTAASDWKISLGRQLEFYRWLQSSEGGIAGGATNSWNGSYSAPPAGDATFYGMAYDPQPVYHDPPSNQWFGFQAWSMERVAEYYYTTGDPVAKALLDKWVIWATSQTKFKADGTYSIPSTLAWSGQPNTWNPARPTLNTNLHVRVLDTTTDVGVTAALAKTLIFYSTRSRNTRFGLVAEKLLNSMWTLYRDNKGISSPEVRLDYKRFGDPVYIPSGWTGKMGTGAPINSSSTFISLRPAYRQDPAWPKVQAYLRGGQAPIFKYHRFWAEADIAIAMADQSELTY